MLQEWTHPTHGNLPVSGSKRPGRRHLYPFVDILPQVSPQSQAEKQVKEKQSIYDAFATALKKEEDELQAVLADVEFGVRTRACVWCHLSQRTVVPPACLLGQACRAVQLRAQARAANPVSDGDKAPPLLRQLQPVCSSLHFTQQMLGWSRFLVLYMSFGVEFCKQARWALPSAPQIPNLSTTTAQRNRRCGKPKTS